MPRNRPCEVRAAAALRPRPQGAASAIDGLSSSASSEIARLERTRNYLRTGDVGSAVLLWKNHVRRPTRELRHYYEFGDVHDFCCGSPVKARDLLDIVISAMSPRSARELRAIIGRLDAQLEF